MPQSPAAHTRQPTPYFALPRLHTQLFQSRTKLDISSRSGCTPSPAAVVKQRMPAIRASYARARHIRPRQGWAAAGDAAERKTPADEVERWVVCGHEDLYDQQTCATSATRRTILGSRQLWRPEVCPSKPPSMLCGQWQGPAAATFVRPRRSRRLHSRAGVELTSLALHSNAACTSAPTATLPSCTLVTHLTGFPDPHGAWSGLTPHRSLDAPTASDIAA